MRLIKALAITDAILADTNVPEDEAAWSIGTTYAQDAIVRVNHSLYQSVAGGNVGHDPETDDGTNWVYVSASNRWKMFDTVNESQTVNPDSIEITLETTGIVDSLAALNLSAGSLHFTITAPDATIVHDQTIVLVDNSEVIDAYTYCFSEIRRKTDVTITGVSLYAGCTIEVTLTEAGADVKCGTLIVGQSKYIGQTNYSPRLGIIDYSLKETDAQGVSVFTKRSYRRKSEFEVMVDNAAWDGVYTLLSDLRATPLVWIGSEQFGSTTIFGWYADFAGVIAYPQHTLLSISLEGLS